MKDDNSDDEEKEEETKSKDELNGRDSFLEPNQKLEIVKITKCKMRAKDTLEFEFGL